MFHIFHRLDRFSGSSFPMSCLPASPRYSVEDNWKLIVFNHFQLSSLSVGHHIFPIRGQLFHSYFFLPDVTVPVFLSSRLFLCIFRILCHLFHSCHVYTPSNSKFSPSLFFLCFSFFSFHFGIPFKIFVSRQRIFFAVFLLASRLGTLAPSNGCDSVLFDWSSAFVFLAPYACRQLPLLPI